MMSSSPKRKIPRREGNPGLSRDLFAALENPQGLSKKQNPTSWLGVGGLGHQNPDYQHPRDHHPILNPRGF